MKQTSSIKRRAVSIFLVLMLCITGTLGTTMTASAVTAAKVDLSLSFSTPLTTWTNSNIEVTAIAYDAEDVGPGNSEISLLRLQKKNGGGTWDNVYTEPTLGVQPGSSTATLIYSIPENGEYRVQAQKTGVNGNKTFTVDKIDKVYPDVTGVVLNGSTPLTAGGTTHHDFAVNPSVTISGTDDMAIQRIAVLKGGTVLATLPAAGIKTAFSQTYTILDGPGTYTFRIVDKAGNRTDFLQTFDALSTGFAVTNTILTPSAATPTNGSVDVRLRHEVTAPVTVTSRTITIDGNPVATNGTSNNNRTDFTATKNGTYNYAITNSLGKTVTGSVTITNIDTEVPTVVYVPGTNDGNKIIDGTGPMGSMLTFSDNVGLASYTVYRGPALTNVVVPTAALSGLSQTITLPELKPAGRYFVVIKDVAGNEAKVEFVQVTAGGPSITMNAPAAGWNKGPVTITGTAKRDTSGSAGALVSIEILKDGIAFDTIATINNPTTNFSFDVTEAGVYKAIVTDAKGLTSDFSLTIGDIFDNDKPELTVLYDDSAFISSGSVPLSVSATDKKSGLASVTVTVDDGTGAVTVFEADAAMIAANKADFITNIDKNCTVVITAVDALGNKEEITKVFSNFDTTAPTITFNKAHYNNRPTAASWQNTDYQLNMKEVFDGGSGIKILTVTAPDGTVVYNYTGGFTTLITGQKTFLTMPGIYIYYAEDYVGNKTTEKVESFVDKTRPELTSTISSDPSAAALVRIDVATDGAPVDETSIVIVDSGKIANLDTSKLASDGYFTFEALENGDYTVFLKDAAGNESTPNPFVVTVGTIDDTPPAIDFAGTWPTEWLTAQPSITVNLSDNCALGRLEIYRNGTLYLEKDYTAADATDTITQKFPKGDYEFKLWDFAGNLTVVNPDAIGIDKTAPVLAVNNLPTGWFRKLAGITVTATDADSGVEKLELCLWNDSYPGLKSTVLETVAGDTMDLAALTYVLEEGASYTVFATDNKGNESYIKLDLSKYDITAPVITPDTISTALSKTGFDVSFNVTDNLSGLRTIEVDGVEKLGAPDLGSLSVDSSFFAASNGVYKIVVKDRAGNSATLDVTVDTIDTVSPVIIDVYGNPTAWQNTTATVTVEAMDADSGIDRVVLRKDNAKFMDDVDLGGGLYEFAGLLNGDYVIRVVDNAGNVTNQNLKVEFVDTVLPVVSLDLSHWPTNPWTTDPLFVKVNAFDTISDVATIHLFKGTPGDEVDLGACALSSFGANWSASNFFDENGDYFYRVTDNAGNVIDSDVITVDCVDVSAPIITYAPTVMPTAWQNYLQTINFSVMDDANGSELAYVTVTSGGVTYYENYAIGAFTLDFSLDLPNGSYTVEAADVAGNVVFNTDLEIVHVDTAAPVIDALWLDPASWTNQAPTVFADITEYGDFGFATGSGVQRIVIHEMINGIANLRHDIVTFKVGVQQFVNGYSFTLDPRNADYRLRVFDHAGNMTEELFSVTMYDNVAPVIDSANITGNPTVWVNTPQEITVPVSDDNGIQRVAVRLNGEIIKIDGIKKTLGATNYDFTFIAPCSGTFRIIVVDLAGNRTTYDLVVNKIDIVDPGFDVNPEMDIDSLDSGDLMFLLAESVSSIASPKVLGDAADYDPDVVTGLPTDWSNSPAIVRLFAKDDVEPGAANSGLAEIYVEKDGALIDGSLEVLAAIGTSEDGPIEHTYAITLSENGSYRAVVIDVAGNEQYINFIARYFDMEDPIVVDVTGNPTDWTNQSQMIEVSLEDNLSGLSRVELYDGDGSLIDEVDLEELGYPGVYGYRFEADRSQVYKVIAYDRAGNSVEEDIDVNKIDKDAPVLKALNGVPDKKVKTAEILATIADVGDSGLSTIKIVAPNNDVISDVAYHGENSVVSAFTATMSGNYIAYVTDRAGNGAALAMVITNVDAATGIPKTSDQTSSAVIVLLVAISAFSLVVMTFDRKKSSAK